jgi:uncharacterized RDD family membrane protein YckC
MTDIPPSTQPPGWYHAQGDPPGTHRYWDGSQWQGGPQPVAQTPSGSAFNPAMPGLGHNPAEYGQRVVAYLIDLAAFLAIFVAGFILSAILGAVSDVLGLLASLLTFAAYIAFFVWNFVLQQGATGQTIGKKQQGIKLVADATGQPVGGGMAFVRYLLASAIATVTCGVAGLLDLLWPLWDPEKKRLTDKILKFSVVKA